MSVDVLEELRREARELKKRLKTVTAAIKILAWTSGKSTGKKRGLSAAARAKMSRAAKKRWRKIKAARAGKE